MTGMNLTMAAVEARAEEYRRLMHEFVQRYAELRADLAREVELRTTAQGQMIAAGTAIRDKDVMIGHLERAINNWRKTAETAQAECAKLRRKLAARRK